MSDLVLPDSRMKDPKGTVVADWPIYEPDGFGGIKTRTIRLEMEPIFCFNCGKPNGYVPVGLMSFVSWMCDYCAEAWGGTALLHNHADQEFWDKVEAEMVRVYGHALTQAELEKLAGSAGGLSRGLELLERESPYRKMSWNT